jgi:uncharacterized protein (DUF2249 family)
MRFVAGSSTMDVHEIAPRERHNTLVAAFTHPEPGGV